MWSSHVGSAAVSPARNARPSQGLESGIQIDAAAGSRARRRHRYRPLWRDTRARRAEMRRGRARWRVRRGTGRQAGNARPSSVATHRHRTTRSRCPYRTAGAGRAAHSSASFVAAAADEPIRDAQQGRIHRACRTDADRRMTAPAAILHAGQQARAKDAEHGSARCRVERVGVDRDEAHAHAGSEPVRGRRLRSRTARAAYGRSGSSHRADSRG